MVNYLFLDVDGVLNNWNWTTNRFLAHSGKGALLCVNDTLVNNLKLLYDAYDLKIVLSKCCSQQGAGGGGVTYGSRPFHFISKTNNSHFTLVSDNIIVNLRSRTWICYTITTQLYLIRNICMI